MAGIKIHQYPLERTSFGDEDFYDIDYWDGTGYQSAKVKGSTLKSALGYSFIDIASIISGYTLAPTDAGKVITNSNTAVVRTLVINNALSGVGNTFHIKGRVALQPLTGVNIDLPDGTTITEPTQYTCIADTHYILHRKASTGNDWVLSAINSETLSNLGSKDLAQLDLIREYEVFEDGTLKFVTNDAGNDAKLQIGENSAERFGEIELNSETFNQTVAVQDAENNGIGVIVRVNPNEFDIDSREDISNSATRRNRLYFSPDETILEHFEGGRLDLSSNVIGGNTFTDFNEEKQGLKYDADYSADFVDRSLVDKAYVDANSGARVYNGADTTPLTKRSKIRFTDFLGAVDDAIEEETVVSLDSNITKDVNTSRFGLNLSDEVDLKIPDERMVVGDSDGNATNLTGTEGNLIGFKEDNKITQFEGVEAFNILKETGITGDKQLSLIGIDGVASNLKATFIIDEILIINTTANSVVVSVGSTAGGTDIANAITIGANATVVLTLGTRYFSSTLGQNLFISSALWNSANVTISVTVKKIHYV
jgi:hypothetical protein